MKKIWNRVDYEHILRAEGGQRWERLGNGSICMSLQGKEGEPEVCLFVYVHIRGEHVVIGRLCMAVTCERGRVVTSNMPWGKAI